MLKVLALIFMTIDHIGYYFFGIISDELYLACRLIGRLAFPIFAYLTALGYRRTRNLLNYCIRLFAFAVPAQFIFSYAKQNSGFFENMNILFTFGLSIVFITAFEIFANGNYDRLVKMEPLQETGEPVKLPWQFRFNLGFSMNPLLAISLGLLFMFLSLFAALYFETDYAAYGIITVFLFYLAMREEDRKTQFKQALLYQSFFNLIVISTSYLLREYYYILPRSEYLFKHSSMQAYSVLALFIIYQLPKRFIHRDKRPAAWQKYFFYLYYPLHVLILVMIRNAFF